MKKINFSGSLGDYQWEETEDGSYTLFSSYFNENCHSTSGALNETIYNYIKGCRVLDFLERNGYIHIFELGFGTGLGLKATLEFLIDKYQDNSIELRFSSCELDKELAYQSLLELARQQLISAPKWDERYSSFHGELISAPFNKESKYTIIIGDIRQEMDNWVNSPYFIKVDAIYQDAFSPKRSPSLWTYQWFQDLSKISHEATIMSTYSSTKSVWKAMIKGGWTVEMVKGYGAKRLSTRAYQKGQMTEEICELLKRSPTQALSDPSS